MAVKIKDYITRDTKILMSTFNTMPKPESMVQNQRLLLEAICDVRKELLELLFRTDWLKKAKPPKATKIKIEEERDPPKLSRRAEAALPLEERVKVISDRFTPKEAPTDEDVEAF